MQPLHEEPDTRIIRWDLLLCRIIVLPLQPIAWWYDTRIRHYRGKDRQDKVNQLDRRFYAIEEWFVKRISWCE